MRIVILSPSIDPVGGVEVFSQTLKNVFISYGHDVSIIGREDIQNKFILKISKYFGLAPVALGYLLGNKAKLGNYDLIITSGLLGWGLKYGNITNIQHGTYRAAAVRIDKKNPFKFFIRYCVWGYFEGLCARNANKTFAVSTEAKSFVEKFYHKDNVGIIPNIVDIDVFKPIIETEKIIERQKYHIPKDHKIIIFVGRYEYAKGKDVMDSLVQNFDDQTALLVVDNQVSLNYKNKKIILKENTTHDEVNGFYNLADLFILPSLHEGSATVLLEAMASGLPFVISNVGLAQDFKNQNIFTNSIVDDFNVQNYKKSINYFLNLDKITISEYSLKARQYIVENHSIEIAKNSYKILL